MFFISVFAVLNPEQSEVLTTSSEKFHYPDVTRVGYHDYHPTIKANFYTKTKANGLCFPDVYMEIAVDEQLGP